MNPTRGLQKEIGEIADLIILIQIKVIHAINRILINYLGTGGEMANDDVLVTRGERMGIVSRGVLNHCRPVFIRSAFGNSAVNPFQIRKSLGSTRNQENPGRKYHYCGFKLSHFHTFTQILSFSISREYSSNNRQGRILSE